MMDQSTILNLRFKEDRIGAYSREILSAVFHLFRNLLLDFPNETEIPLVEYLQSDFEQLLNQYHMALIHQQSLHLTDRQQTLAQFLLAPEKTSLDEIIEDNDVELLRWVVPQRHQHRDHQEDSPKNCAIAASKGYLVCLQVLHQNGCPWDTVTC